MMGKKSPRPNMASITGTGCFCAAGTSVQKSWQTLLRAETNCSRVPERLFRTELNYPVFSAPENCLTTQAKALLDSGGSADSWNLAGRTVRLAFAAVAEAIAQAGLSLDELRAKRLGIAMGTTVGCNFHDEEYFSAWRNGQAPDIDPFCLFLGSNIAEALHRLLGTSGPAAVVVNACASGSDAIGLAKDWIENDFCDYALAGGADELSRVAYNGFVSLMLVDENICRPFDQNRNGLNLGEGAGALFLEPLASATSRDQAVQGLVRGFGSASDAWHPTAPHPEGRGLKMALRSALAEAGLDPSEIAYVNCHGTGTKANDLAETTALAAFFTASDTAIVSTKGAVGHTLGAAGGIEAVFTLKALQEGICPGTVGCKLPDEAFPIAPLPQGIEKKLLGRFGISQSLAFGGGNAVLVLEAC